MEKPKQYCHVCQQEVDYSSRSPRYVCHDCREHMTDEEGRPVDFFNVAMFGHGCQGAYKDTGDPYTSTICYIQGIPCVAAEHHFGGIVVEGV